MTNERSPSVSSEPPYIEVEFVELDKAKRKAAIIWLSRPEALNAINWQALREMEAAFQAVEQDPDVRAVLVTGRGRAFSAGGDIKAYQHLQADGAAFTDFVDDCCRIYGAIAKMTKPVLALVNGICAAGGLELLLACDFAWGAQSARIGDMHINFAQIGGSGAMARLPRLIGQARSLELVFSGEMLSASVAHEWGIVNRVIPDDQLLEEGLRFARSIAAKSPSAVKFIKQSVTHGMDTDLPQALKFERDQCLRYCLTLPDSQEGISAFVEKRDPIYGNAQ